MKQKIQKFGGAMFTPVLLFAFAGIMVGLATTCMNPQIMGDLANPESIWYKFWAMISAGAITVFNQLPVLFAVSLPIALAKKQNARACMETFVIYITFNYFVSEFLNQFGSSLGFDFCRGGGRYQWTCHDRRYQNAGYRNDWSYPDCGYCHLSAQ